MRTFRFLIAALLMGIALGLGTVAAAAATGAERPAATAKEAEKITGEATLRDLEQLVKKVQAKLNDGKRTEPEFTAELKEFDALIGKAGKTAEGAQALAMKAMIYAQVFEDFAKAKDLFKKVATDYPGTPVAQRVPDVLNNIERVENMRKIQQSLVVGAKFPDFQEKDVEGKPLSVSQHKGKVVLVDFWATWCMPCRVELPNVIATYQKHHKNGFEIVGISLDQDGAAMKNFTKSSGMPWQQFFDGQLWQNKLAQQYGIMSIPATFLLDKQGTIIGRDLRGPELEQAVADALAKK